MLNPDKIKEKEFQTTGRGSYRADDVDSFLAEVSSSYEQMFKENGELVKKISLLANKVEEYKKDENSLKEALLAAQKLADKIVADAKEKIKSDLADAQDKVDGMLSSAKGEAADIVAKDVTDADLVNVNVLSIGAIFIIILLIFKSISLPIILVAVIEFAIMLNMAIPYYQGTSLPFVASIVIGAIQLGATVDYAILMTTRYQKERQNGKDKKEAISIAHKIGRAHV